MTGVVLALDSFKGSIGAADAVAAVADGWREAVAAAADGAAGAAGFAAVPRPMADGGEGTVEAFAAAVPGAQRMPVTVTGPRGDQVETSWLLLPDGTGVVELATTCGIELLGDERLPWDAGTVGFGQAIAAALDHGVGRLVLGIGSSASTDGGAGMLTALGARLLDDTAAPIVSGARGLATVASVDLSRLRPLPEGGVTVLSDVTNPLCGAAGAAAVFGPQKGLDAAGIVAADAALARFAALVQAGGGTGAADAGEPGAGAAGGTGFGLLAWGAQLVPGAAEVAALIGLRAAIAEADLVVTGEGSFDGQSAAGKVPCFVAQLAHDAGVPVALVAGRIADDADLSGFVATVSLTDLAGSGAAAMADPAHWLRAAGAVLAGTAGR